MASVTRYYYEYSDDIIEHTKDDISHRFHVKVWRDDKKKSHTRYLRYAHRAWIELDDGSVHFIKNLVIGAPYPKVDMKEFLMIKLSSVEFPG